MEKRARNIIKWAKTKKTRIINSQYKSSLFSLAAIENEGDKIKTIKWFSDIL